MKTIAMIALATALGLTWVGAAIPADVKDETKEKAETTKDKLKSTGETTKDKLKSTGETTKDKLKSAGEKTKEKLTEAKDKIKEKIKGDKNASDRTAGRAASADVRSAQQSLKDKGFDPGPVDGVMGPKTRAAVTDFQKKEGLKVTGRLDAETAARLGGQSQTSRAPGAAPSASPATAEPAKPEGAKTQK
jgi:peptidoglycan hydrolase-like protein with peptidoglycan-binding domain